MTTYYVDYEGGNDASAGTSFATRWKTFTSGATGARVTYGDTVRLMASPDPTSLGINGTWTDGPQGTAGAITSSTNATPIVVTAAGHGLATGDSVIVENHATNTKANGVWEVTVSGSTFTLLNADGSNSVGNGVGGTTGTYRKATNLRVLLASAITANVACTGNAGTKTNWTASANVTCSVYASVFSATNKEGGGECQQIDIGGSFTTGKAAYLATGTLNLSGYQQLSFWIKQTAGTIGAASSLTLRLCSDAAGVTTVDTFNIPSLVVLNSWVAFTVNKGSNMGSSIASIAFDVNTDNGAQTFLIDNIIACKAVGSADSLSLVSMIGKNNGTDTWSCIQSINGKRVMLDRMGTNFGPLAANNQDRYLTRGYSGTTATVTAYKRETIKVAMGVNVYDGSAEFELQRGGQDGNRTVYSGGWDRTAMSSQSGETWLDGQNSMVAGLSGIQSFVGIDSISVVKFYNGHYWTLCHDIQYTNVHLNNCAGRGLYSNQNSKINGTIKALCWNNIGMDQQVDLADLTIPLMDGNFEGLLQCGTNNKFAITYARNNTWMAIEFVAQGGNCVVKGMTTKDNGCVDYGYYPILQGYFNGSGANYLVDCTLQEATEVTSAAWGNSRLWSKNHDGSAGNHVCFTDYGLITAQTAVCHTASGVAWKIDVTSANRSVNYPLDFEIAKVAVKANGLVTVKAWMRRTNTGLTHSLVCKGGQIAGVTSDVSATMSVAADTWEQLTITFTPTEAGVVCIRTESYGGTTYSGYVDDMTITQA